MPDHLQCLSSAWEDQARSYDQRVLACADYEQQTFRAAALTLRFCAEQLESTCHLVATLAALQEERL